MTGASLLIPVLVSLIPGYLLGSIPFGFVVGKALGVDIRKQGSGNIGATNVLRTMGRKWGVLVFTLDALKGLVAVLAIERLIGIDTAVAGPHLSEAQAGILAGVGCILGHNFPVWLGFKGGKGIATSAGVLLGLAPLATILALTVWVLTFYGTRYVSVASIVAAATLPTLIGIQQWIWRGRLDVVFWFAAVAAVLAIGRHRPNIQRLLAGTEHRFERKK